MDLGSVNTNLECVFTEEDTNSEGGELADQLFVLMARAIFKPLSIPVAHYFSSKLKG